MPSGGAEHTVEPGHRHHVDDGAHTLALVTDEPGHGVVELGLAGRVGAVAELVLEPLDAEGVPASVRQHARNQEARQAAGRLGEHQEEIVHRRAGEPLVSAQPPGAVGLFDGGRGVGAHIGTALLLRHPHTGEQAALGCGVAEPRLVHTAGQQGFVRLGEVGGAAQRRDDGVRHRDRAQMALLQHRGQHEAARRGRHGPRGARRPRRRPPAPHAPRRPSGSGRRGGTRPRRPGGRSGRGYAAPAHGGWPGPPSAGPPRCRHSGRSGEARPGAMRRPRGVSLRAVPRRRRRRDR